MSDNSVKKRLSNGLKVISSMCINEIGKKALVHFYYNFKARHRPNTPNHRKQAIFGSLKGLAQILSLFQVTEHENDLIVDSHQVVQ